MPSVVPLPSGLGPGGGVVGRAGRGCRDAVPWAHATLDPVLAAQCAPSPVTDDTTAFYAAARAAVEGIPVRIDTWEGTDSPVPDAAGQLLRPNVLFARTYRDSAGPEWAKLIVIHCKDTRDMSGHYPPNCYRGSGWTQMADPQVQTLQIWGRQVPVAQYRFTRTEFRGTVDWLIYDFFVLPLGGFVTNMTEIQKASGDYRTRPYGAAQIQVIMDSSLSPESRERILRLMLEPIGPVIDQLQTTRPGARP